MMTHTLQVMENSKKKGEKKKKQRNKKNLHLIYNTQLLLLRVIHNTYTYIKNIVHLFFFLLRIRRSDLRGDNFPS